MERNIIQLTSKYHFETKKKCKQGKNLFENNKWSIDKKASYF
jgi:hypothetical protein